MVFFFLLGKHNETLNFSLQINVAMCGCKDLNVVTVVFAKNCSGDLYPVKGSLRSEFAMFSRISSRASLLHEKLLGNYEMNAVSALWTKAVEVYSRGDKILSHISFILYFNSGVPKTDGLAAKIVASLRYLASYVCTCL